jgi:hypothetical protein
MIERCRSARLDAGQLDPREPIGGPDCHVIVTAAPHEHAGEAAPRAA